MRRERLQTQIPWLVWGSTKPKEVVGCEWKAIKSNPLKPQQIQGWRRVEIKVEVKNGLHLPQDVGIPEWQKHDIED